MQQTLNNRGIFLNFRQNIQDQYVLYSYHGPLISKIPSEMAKRGIQMILYAPIILKR